MPIPIPIPLPIPIPIPVPIPLHMPMPIRIPLPIPHAVTAVSLWGHDQMRHLRRLAHSRSTLSKRVPVSVTDCTNWSVLDSNRGSTQEHVDTRRLYTKSTRETLC